MSFLLWQRQGEVRIGAPRLVLRAAEVPLLADAQQLCKALEQLRHDAQERIDAAEREARERGHAQGREAAAREASEALGARLIAMEQAAALERARVRDEIGALALQVVRKMLGHFAADAVLAALARTAAADMLPAQQLALVVHPRLCDAVRTRLAAEAPTLHVEVRADPACASDSCRIETEHGSVDAALDAQLARLAAAWGKGR